MLLKKDHRWFIPNVKTIPGEFQHVFVIADIDKRKIRKVVRDTCIERREITWLKDVKIRKRFEEKVTKLVDVGALNLWGRFKDGILMACDEVCGKKRGRRSKGDTWWLNEDVWEAVSRKKEAHKTMCQNNTEKNKRRYEGMRNKAVSKAMREKAEEELTELQNCSNGMFRPVKRLKTDSKEIEFGRCMRGSDGLLCFSEKERGKFWKDYVER